MIMGWMDDDDIVWAVENGVEFFVFDHAGWIRWFHWQGQTGKPALDTY
jgi:hypothetical protein